MPFFLAGIFLTTLFVVISFLILIINYFPENGLDLLKKLDFSYIFLAFLLFLLYHTLDALRLRTIAKGYGINYSLSYGYATSLIATFGSTVTPAHIGGELIIFYMFRRLGIKPHKIWGTILFKTISGLSFFIIAFPIFIGYAVYNTKILKKLAILLAIFIVFALISFPLLKVFSSMNVKAGLKRKIKLYCYAVLYFWRYKKKQFILACLYSSLLYLTFLSFAPILLKAFHVKVSLIQLYLLQLPLVYAIFSSPTPGGSGVGELGGIAIFSDLLPSEMLGIFIILWRFFSQYLGASLGGILFTVILWKDSKRKNQGGSFTFDRRV